MNPTILIVDDEHQVRHSIAQWLELCGYSVEAAVDADAAMAAIRRQPPAVVLTDFKMPRKSGMDLMREIRNFDADIPIILLTAHGDISLAVEAMRAGAYDFLQKPYEPGHLSLVVARAMEQRRLKFEVRRLSDRVAKHEGLEARLAGSSSAMLRVRESAAELAMHNCDVIITGETGTGKEVVARALHDFGRRAHMPFVAVNCAAIPHELSESELFGHEAGAFTSARGVRIGKFESANGGTILLDEIESMPIVLQAKLLRVLQERVVERIGSNQCIPIDVRVVAATKCDLREQSRAGKFRDDLYFRLAGAEIALPALRDRQGDVLLLFEHFTSSAATTAGRKCPPLTSSDVEALLTHRWPGNVRELKTIAERYALGLKATGGTIHEMLGRSCATSTERNASLADSVAAYEKRLIEAALREHGGSITAVTESLHVPRRTLNEKMAKFGLSRTGPSVNAQDAT